MNAMTRPTTAPASAPASAPRSAPSAAATPATASRLPVHDARALTEGGVQAAIELDGQTYFLRITRAGKLILTK